METNLYDNDTTLPWIAQQNQLYEGRHVAERASQQRPPVLQNARPQQRNVDQKPKAPERMPKARALALVRTLKKWLVIASLASFVTFSGLVAYHQVATPTNQTNQSSSGSSQATSSSSNGFFNSQGGNNFGSSNSSQAPVSGSSVS